MDWRGRLRRLINREDYPSPWRLAAMRIVDPVEWYMRKNDGENVRPGHRRPGHQPGVGWTYAPLEEPAPDRELHERLLEEASRRRDAGRRAREDLRREYASFFEAKARELSNRNEVTIEGATGRVQAKLVRFRTGAVFEYADSRGARHGMTRIERSQLADPVPMLAAYLENVVLGLGADPGPLM